MKTKTTKQFTEEYLKKMEQLCRERGVDEVLRELQDFHYTPTAKPETVVALTLGLKEMLAKHLKTSKQSSKIEKLMSRVLDVMQPRKEQ